MCHGGEEVKFEWRGSLAVYVFATDGISIVAGMAAFSFQAITSNLERRQQLNPM